MSGRYAVAFLFLRLLPIRWTSTSSDQIGVQFRDSRRLSSRPWSGEARLLAKNLVPRLQRGPGAGLRRSVERAASDRYVPGTGRDAAH